jgi:hypothetical protein
MVQELLDRRWSPEQISQHLRRIYPSQPERHLVPETIYQAIYVQGRGVNPRTATVGFPVSSPKWRACCAARAFPIRRFPSPWRYCRLGGGAGQRADADACAE